MRCMSPASCSRCRGSARARRRPAAPGLPVGRLPHPCHQPAAGAGAGAARPAGLRGLLRCPPGPTTAARCAAAWWPRSNTSRSCAAWATRTSRKRVRELGIDILVDLKGATHDTLLPVFAARPAPLQVTWLGFPGSTGAPYIDYLIGDPVVTPLAHAGHFAEKIAQMPLCYQPNDARRERPQPSRAPTGACPTTRCCCAPSTSRTRSPQEVFDALVLAAARARRCAAVAAAVEHQRAGHAARRGRRAASTHSGCCSRRWCRCSSI